MKNKTLLIFYSYHHGNTEKIANVFSRVLDARIKTPEQINQRELYEYDLIGFGSGIYGGKPHEFLLDLAYELPPETGRRAFIFSTCGAPAFAYDGGHIHQELYDNHLPLREMLTSKGYTVVDEFICPGYNTFSFLRLFGGINKGRPNERDFVKAAAYATYGPPEVLRLQEVEKPVPKDNEISIRVRAATVTRGDVRMRSFTVPASVRGHAEYVCLAEDGMAAVKPDGLTFEEAAAFPSGGAAAQGFFKRAGMTRLGSSVRPGHQVLINGASGTLGTSWVQLAAYCGADVTGVCSSANIELVKNGKIKPVIDRIYPLEEIIEAHRYVDTERKKVMLLSLSHNFFTGVGAASDRNTIKNYRKTIK